MSKFTAAVKVLDAQADFVKRACEKAELSGAAFTLQALKNECESVLEGEDFPADPPKADRQGAPTGSKIPEARELGLSTKEYRRRVKILELAGVKATPEAVKNVPPAPVKAKKAA